MNKPIHEVIIAEGTLVITGDSSICKKYTDARKPVVAKIKDA